MMTPEERARKLCTGFNLEPWQVAIIAAGIRAATEDVRERVRAEVQAIHADYPADVFPSREGQAARHVAKRVLCVIDALARF